MTGEFQVDSKYVPQDLHCMNHIRHHPLLYSKAFISHKITEIDPFADQRGFAKAGRGGEADLHHDTARYFPQQQVQPGQKEGKQCNMPAADEMIANRQA